jgi:hypothetical protein
MALSGKLASQVSKLLSRKQVKFLGEQKDILATEPSAATAKWEETTVPMSHPLPSTLQLDEPTVMQHSRTLPEFEEPSVVAPAPIPEKLARKWKWQKIAHGVKQTDDRPAPLAEMKPFLDLRFRLDEKFKLIDDVTNDIVSKDALLNTLSNPQSEEVGQIFSFIGDNKTKPFLSRSQTKKYNRPGRTLGEPTTFLPRKEEILFDVKEFNLPANEILVEDGVLWKLQRDLNDLISDPKYRRAGQDEEYYDKLESGINILSDVLKTPAFKKEVPIEDVEYTKATEMLELKEVLEKKQEQEFDPARKKFIEDVGKMEIPSDLRKKSSRFYKRIRIDDFVRIAKDKRKEEIRKNPNQIPREIDFDSEISDWGPGKPDKAGTRSILQEGIVESPEIRNELMFYSSLERDGFIQGGSQELIREGVSLSFDPLLSFRKFAKEDLDRMVYVDLPEDMSANDIVNLSSADYLIPEDKDGIILKPNVFNEKEIFVTKEGGFRDKVNVRRLDEDEKRELLRLNRSHEKAIVTTDTLEEMRSLEWGISHYNRLQEGKYTPTTIKELQGTGARYARLRASQEAMIGRADDDSIDLAPNQTAVERIVDNFTVLHKQLTDPEEYISKIEAGDNAAATIRTLYSDIEAYEKQLQGNLIKVSRHISDLTNQLRKLKANKSASLDIIKQLYFKTPTYQLVGDMVVMKKLKQRLAELAEANKKYKALSPKGMASLSKAPMVIEKSRRKYKALLKEILEPVFEKPLPSNLTLDGYGSELENFRSTQKILEEIDDPTFLKIYLLNDILKMRASTRSKSKNFSYEVKTEYADKKRLSPSDVGKEHAERFKKANSSKLTKLWSDYTKANEVTLEFMLKNFGYAMGGVVDMRNGGKVGAAVVAASLLASGGQAMDMRNGGVVGMVQGGPVIDYATPEEKEFDPEVSKQMDALLAKRYAEEKQAAVDYGGGADDILARQAAVDYGGFEQPAPMPDAVPPVPREKPRTHIHGAAKELVMKHLSRFKIQDKEQALNNLNSWTEKVLQAESDGDWEAKELGGTTTASGGFQFVKGSVEPALNRLERRMKRKMPWRDELLKHKDASKLTAEQQTLLFLGDILEKRVGAPGTGDELIKKILSGDKQGMYDAWYTMHHTIPTDPKLRIGAKWGKGMTVVPSRRLERIFGLKVSSNPTVN